MVGKKSEEFHPPFPTTSLSFRVTTPIPYKNIINLCASLLLALPSISAMASSDSEIIHEFPPFFRVFKDGSKEMMRIPHEPPPPQPKPGVDLKDVVVSPETGVSVLIFSPKIDGPHRKLPLLVHYHGGGFCVGSALDSVTYNYLTGLVAAANLIAVSVEYRLALEHPLPVAHEDSWAALQWIASHADGSGPESLLNNHVDFGRVFLVGESAGANLAHHMAVRAGVAGLGGVKVVGLILVHPFFVGKEPDKMIECLYPGCSNVNEDPKMNPGADPNLSKMGGERVLVFVAEKDWLRPRGRSYCETLSKSGWAGTVVLVENEGADHCFHLFNPSCEETEMLLKRTVSFINQATESTP